MKDKGYADLRRDALRAFMKQFELRPLPWSRAAGISPSAIYNFLNGRAESLSQPTLEALARAVGRPVSEITGEAGIRLAAAVQSVTVLGTVEAGHWIEAFEWPLEDQFEIMVTPKKGRRNLFGLVVHGPSMNQRYPDGTILVCAPLHHLRRDLKSGDRVIVERRNRDGLVEATVKELVIDDDSRAWLWPRSDHPRHQQPVHIPWPPDPAQHDDDQGIEEITVFAIVIGAYHPEE